MNSPWPFAALVATSLATWRLVTTVQALPLRAMTQPVPPQLILKFRNSTRPTLGIFLLRFDTRRSVSGGKSTSSSSCTSSFRISSGGRPVRWTIASSAAGGTFASIGDLALATASAIPAATASRRDGGSLPDATLEKTASRMVCDMPASIDSRRSPFIGLLPFDCVVGNQDRERRHEGGRDVPPQQRGGLRFERRLRSRGREDSGQPLLEKRHQLSGIHIGPPGFQHRGRAGNRFFRARADPRHSRCDDLVDLFEPDPAPGRAAVAPLARDRAAPPFGGPAEGAQICIAADEADRVQPFREQAQAGDSGERI